jgi:hypothetical protein
MDTIKDNRVSVLEMLTNYLKEHMLDGLVNDNEDCYCLVANLVDCNNFLNLHHCVAAYKAPCPEGICEFDMLPLYAGTEVRHNRQPHKSTKGK